MLGMSFLQRLGRALQLPIATLPIAALFLRLGQPDLLNIASLHAAGASIFDHLPLIFAIGIASAWSIHTSGAAALAGATSYFILTSAMGAIDATNNMGALAGILSGLLAGMVYNRWHQLKLPEFLAFFGGSRSVPIISGFFSIGFAIALGHIWPKIQGAMEALGIALQNLGPLGSGIYGIVNRSLLPTGLHQILNNYVWYQLGTFKTLTGQIVSGDMSRFYAQDPTAGMFMSGFFPIMIFGLPAAAFAMYQAAKPDQKKEIFGIVTSVSFTALIAGITEPLEFLFMFSAPPLYLFHVLCTGLSLYWCAASDVHAGFSFSAGLIDLILISTFSNTKHLGRLLMIGLFFSIIYYLFFYWTITACNLSVPSTISSSIEEHPIKSNDSPNLSSQIPTQAKAQTYFDALGGESNLISLESCITRLRVELRDLSKCDDLALRKLGALGVTHLDAHNIQVIVGTSAETLCQEINTIWQQSTDNAAHALSLPQKEGT